MTWKATMARFRLLPWTALIGMGSLPGGFLATPGAEGRVQVDSRVDRQTITVGDPITYTLTLTGDPQDQIRIPALGAALEQFTIRDYQEQGPAPDGQGHQIYRATYVITRYETGEFQIPPVQVKWTDPGGSEHTLSTDPLTIRVRSVYTGGAADIRGAKPPVPIPRDSRQAVRLAALAAGLLGLAGAAARVRRRWRREAPEEAPAEPPRPPHEVALEALQRLAESELLRAGQIREFYFELADILRRYLESRFGVAAMERPTGLLIRELQRVPVAPEEVARIDGFLQDCDLAKFAQYRPAPEETGAHLELARQIILETMEETAGDAETRRGSD